MQVREDLSGRLMPAEAPEYSTKSQSCPNQLGLPPCGNALTRTHPGTTMRPVPPREASAPNARVLIVDDDVSVTELFARMLRLEGFEVWAAHSADEGLSLAQTHRPHAVILDLRMPLTSGVQVLRSLRAIPGMQHTPVTIVTGDYYLAESQTAEIKSLGADVRFKPLWLDELVTLARDMLHTPVRD
jgi:two-component system OmpR family response regulator